MVIKKSEYQSTRLEIILGSIAAIFIILSIVKRVQMYIPYQLVVILISAFIAARIINFFKSDEDSFIDYAFLGIIVLFLAVYIMLGNEIHPLIALPFVILILLSVGLSKSLKGLFGANNLYSFLISYVLLILILITFFAGAYSSNKESFLIYGQNASIDFEDSLYFSSITFTTVGLGDIVPLGMNKTLAAIEAITSMIINTAFIGYLFAFRAKNK